MWMDGQHNFGRGKDERSISIGIFVQVKKGKKEAPETKASEQKNKPRVARRRR